MFMLITDKVWFKRPGYHLSYPEEDPQYPFQRVKFVDGRDTGVIMLVAPFYDTNYYRVSWPWCRATPGNQRQDFHVSNLQEVCWVAWAASEVGCALCGRRRQPGRCSGG